MPPVRTIEPRELWRVTDGDEETGDILGEIRDAAVDDAGNTYLLDFSHSTLRVYDPAGKSLGTVGRAGEGPGEFTNPSGCLALADGRVGVTQLLPARVVTFDLTSNPGSDLVPPGAGSFEILESAQTAADAVYLSTHSMVMGGESAKSVVRLRSLALDGSPPYPTDPAQPERPGNSPPARSSRRSGSRRRSSPGCSRAPHPPMVSGQRRRRPPERLLPRGNNVIHCE